jgi:FLVCR family MFS transporter 7
MMNNKEGDNVHINHVENYNYNKNHQQINSSLITSTFSIEEEDRSPIDNDKKTQQPPPIEERTSFTAWIETLVCILLNSSCALMWMTASSTPNVMTAWMNCSLTELNWLSNAAAICNTIFSLLTAWAYEKLGIKTSIILCGVINTAGCWIRCIAIALPANKRFPVVMVGQVIASIGGPLVFK